MHAGWAPSCEHLETFTEVKFPNMHVIRMKDAARGEGIESSLM